MAQIEHQPAAAGKADEADSPVVAKPYAEILVMAQKAASRHGFLAKALHAISERLDSSYAVLYARCGSEVIQEETHRGPTNPGFWRPAVQQFLTDALTDDGPRAKLLSAKGANLKIALLSAPLSDGASGISGALAVVVRGGEAEARAQLQQLDTMAALTASSLSFVAGGPGSRDTGRSDVSASAMARAAGVSSPEELAFALTNSLRGKLGCEQVALGMVRRRHVRILSISGHDDVRRRSPGVVHVRAAMEECLDMGEPIVCQHDSGWADERLTAGHRIHQQWHVSAGRDAVASIPLLDGERCVAVLSLRRRGDEPFHREQIDEVRKLVGPFAPALVLVRQAKRGLPRHTLDSVSDTLGAVIRPGRLGMKLFAGLVVVGAAWFCFGTTEYKVTVPAKLCPAQQRHIAVPYDGVLASAAVTVGDSVREGDVVCQLDQRDLELERDELQAQLAVLERERTQALAADQPVEAQLVEANQRLIRAQLAIVDRRIAQATLYAPFDGVIIRGDLRKSIGCVLAQGEALFDIAPLSRWTLELAAQEGIAGELRDGLSGRFASHAKPEDAKSFRLARVSPSAEVRDGQNVYVVEADIQTEDLWMRPGMEGVARITVGPRAVWWVALHKTLNYLKLKFWL